MSSDPSTLSDDQTTPGNKFCKYCDQSIEKSRTSAHLVSKKHAERYAKFVGAIPAATEAAPEGKKKRTPKEVKASATVPATVPATATVPPEAKKKRTPKDAAEQGTPASSTEAKSKKKPTDVAGVKLPADPDKKGNVICGICRKSIVSSGAKAHLASAVHKDNVEKELSSALQRTKI